jgi:hypothetical protein
VCDPEGIENGYKGVVDPDDERELFKGGRLGESILPRASLRASLCCCCCCVTLWAAALGSCSGYLSVPSNLGTRDSEGLGFTSVGCKLISQDPMAIMDVKVVTIHDMKSTAKEPAVWGEKRKDLP